MEQHNSSAVITISGLPGSGKTTLGRCLDSYSPAEIDPSFSEHYKEVHVIPMRWLLAQHEYRGSNTIAELQTFHQAIRNQGRAEEIFDSLREVKESIIIIDAIRNIDDMQYLQKEFGAFAIGLKVPLAIAKNRFMNDQDDDKHRHSFVQFGQMINDDSLTDEQRIIRSRNMAWDQAIREVGSDPEHYDCVENADAIIEADVSFGQVVTSALGHIRYHIKNQLGALIHHTSSVSESK